MLLLPELNECFLFHGTTATTKDAIVHQGIDYRLGSQGALFGQGCYFTESSTKADQYAGKMKYLLTLLTLSLLTLYTVKLKCLIFGPTSTMNIVLVLVRFSKIP